MKICPLCKLKFDNSTESCPSCKAELEDYDAAQKAEKEKIPKSFWISLLCVFAFIGGLILIYNLVYSNLY